MLTLSAEEGKEEESLTKFREILLNPAIKAVHYCQVAEVPNHDNIPNFIFLNA